MKHKLMIYVTASALVAVGAAGFASAERTPSKGSIPAHAFVDKSVRTELVPDYIVAYDRKGAVAGYVKKEDLFDTNGRHFGVTIPVVDESLKQPVGRMVPGRGFVPLGVRDEEVPLFEHSRTDDVAPAEDETD